jgi:GNAT superfamily N-acetyltransferase
MFRQYHYLSGSIANHARCYAAIYQDKPVAFIAVMHIHMRSRYYRVHRLVVLPDYQGIGLGKRLLNFIAELYSSQTKAPFYIVTSNPQIVRGNMENWQVKRYGHVKRGGGNTRINNEIKASASAKRISITLEYKRQNCLIKGEQA